MFSRTVSDIDRLYLHTALYQLSISLGSTFSIAFLLRQGLSPTTVFLVFAAILSLRFCLRPIALPLVTRLGLRRTLMLGAALNATQFLALPHVRGLDAALLAYVVLMSLGEGVYWTTTHVVFAGVGARGKLGRQVGVRQAIQAAVGVVGPTIGGFAMALIGPWAGFAAAGAMRLFSAAPLLGLRELPPVEKRAPDGAYAAARFGTVAFVSDGWIVACGIMSWNMVVFLSLGSRYDAYGSAIALSALVGAGAGFLLGRHIDRGNGRKAVIINLAAGLLVLLAQAFCGSSPAAIVTVMILAALLGGFSVPALMTAVYTRAQKAPCPFRFQFAAEGGWDAGGAAACLACAGWTALGLPLQTAVLLAAPMLAAQAIVLRRGYAGPAA